jgi:hypothetical protein
MDGYSANDSITGDGAFRALVDWPSVDQEVCTCPAGFSGTFCEIGGDQVCVLPCQNGGVCSYVWQSNSESCDCFPGFQGVLCELPICTIACENGGVCREGLNGDLTEEHCVCPPGLVGTQCEATASTCHESPCLNGASCIGMGSAIARSGLQDFYCDCTTASTEDGFFAGRYCQYESTSVCRSGDNSPNGPRFCVNGGGCLDESKGWCECPGGFLGSRCEFTQEEFLEHFLVCELPCFNGGRCAEGIGALAPVFQPFSANFTYLFGERHIHFEHCSCPGGFFGVQCEHKYSLCGEGDHICFHGSECVAVDDGWQCDCNITSPSAAGLYCQFEVTIVCDETSGSFCTNGGICPSDMYVDLESEKSKFTLWLLTTQCF